MMADSQGMIRGMPHALGGLQVGQYVPENYMTNYDTLGKLIDKYNTYVRTRDTTLQLDTKVADLRDALAHGRVFEPTASPPFRLLKFDKPTNGQVHVTFSASMDAQWFQRQIRLVYTQAEKVMNACKRFAPSMIV